ncbi:MAG: hypothetical protein WCO60_06155 [Verrucomicrobiota bacterium]
MSLFRAIYTTAILGLASSLLADEAQTTHWTEDFSKPADFSKNWIPYGFLASGISPASPLGKSVSGKESRADWWEIVGGTLRSRNFPEEKHQAGITHLASGNDIRLAYRVKIPTGGMSQITIRGNNPIVERNFHIAVLRINPDGISAADNDVIHPKDSPEGIEMKAKGQWNRKFFIAKTEKRAITPDVWHEVVLELRGKEMTAFLDGEKALSYTTLCGDVPKTSIGLAGGRNDKEIMDTWYDDIVLGPLEPNDAIK